MTKAYGYIRTSSATNVGGDSDTRQKIAVQAYADSAGVEIVGWYYDADVRGADPIETRPQFSEMLGKILSNGVRTIIVETASRFSRDLITQETGWSMLKQHDVTLIAADSPQAFLDDTPTAVLIRQVLGAVSQFEKAMLVSKLKGARERKKAANGKCEGRKSVNETNPTLAARIKQLRAEALSFQKIADQLQTEGLTAAPMTAMTVKRIADRA